MKSDQPTYSLIFYGDDFTGSTDALEFISIHGLKTVLFMDVPDAEMLKRFPALDAFGIAGKTRSLGNAEMKSTLENDFTKMAAFSAKHIHYKVCSTFDSSAKMGSIGLAIDIGSTVFKTPLIPVLGGMPLFGRFCAFSNLFVRMGIGSNGKIYRLDRHPSMSKHPVTPADESDLRIHLGRQTAKNISSIDIDGMKNPISEWKHAIHPSDEVVVVDSMQAADLEKFGAWLDTEMKGENIFSIGSSGVEAGLGMHWNTTGKYTQKSEWKKPDSSGPMLILSGSQSPVTANQIAYAKRKGYQLISFDPAQPCTEQTIEELAVQAASFIQQGEHVIVFSGERNSDLIDPSRLGFTLGTMASVISKKTILKRIIVCGGDTSSYVARAMGIIAVEMIAPIIHGAPLCRVHSTLPEIDGKEMNFKGGQVGPDHYFDLIEQGYKN